MSNDIGSFVVNIQAKIEGYQREIAKIKSALESVGKDSKMGKDLQKQLQQVENMVDSLGKKMTQRISSESQITKLVDSLNDVDSAFMKIGQKMQGLTFEDLDMQKYSQQIAGAAKELQVLQEQASKVATTDFSQALTNYMDKFEKFKQAIIGLNIDPESLNLNNFKQVFQDALDGSKEKVQELKTELQDLQRQQEEYQNIAKEASQNANFDPTQAAKQVLDQYSEGIRKLSTENINSLQSGINKWLENINIKDSALKEKIQQQIADAFDIEKSPDLITSIEQLPRQIGTLLQNANLGTMTTFTSKVGSLMGVGEANGASLFKELNLTEVDTTKLQELKQTITDLFDIFKQNGMSAEVAQKATAAALKEYTEGKPAIGIQEVTNALKELQQTQLELANSSNTQASSLQPQIEQLTAEIKAVSSLNRSARMSFQNFGSSKDIVALQQENTQLREEIKNLKAEFENFKTQYANQARGTGSNIERSGAEGLRENNALMAQYSAQLDEVKAKEQMVGKLQGVVQQWFSIYAAIRMVRQAINSIISTIQELDKTITEIAIVTDMTQSDLWGQMSSYTDMARQYASSISGVYQVSQLYYQQGLQTADVMALTEQTLKMARISGLDYAEATDFMTNAIRSFKMEMTDAQRVVDVYSAIAASSATSTTELATAMSKTASSAEAVGSSFENTTAMMAVMIEATRESAENIGSAMKSIISRYGEMTSDPSATVDSEGEEMSLNRVDKALQTVGITLQDATGQFRNFDDVIAELAQKWSSLDNNTQRYIATIMAGNRLIMLAVAWVAIIIIQIKTM